MLENGCIYSERELTDKATVENLTDMQAEVEKTIRVRGLWKKYVNIDENPIVQVDRDGNQL